ncbi:unnamed protein product [Gemmata massiliana]|uniref:Uncharacterized protein n=1 Tax=Gemmata massiliana TaxID=1210884 RepID=A0A6P2DNV2_9BACT|nr:hypothetical protein [Gemmata massiliana]VTS03821.1 unnamed protein product [Gemmata massiliana]
MSKLKTTEPAPARDPGAVAAAVERVRALAAARMGDTAAKYRDLVARTAAGKATNPDDAIRLLDLVGHDATQFAADVEVAVRRIELRTQMVAGTQAVATIAEVDQELAEIEAELVATVKAAEATITEAREQAAVRSGPLRLRHTELSQLVERGQLAEIKLADECPDPTLHARIADLDTQARTAQAAAQAKREENLVALRDTDERLTRLVPYLGKRYDQADAIRYAHPIREAEQQVPVLKQKLDELKAEPARIEAELRAELARIREERNQVRDQMRAA